MIFIMLYRHKDPKPPSPVGWWDLMTYFSSWTYLIYWTYLMTYVTNLTYLTYFILIDPVVVFNVFVFSN